MKKQFFCKYNILTAAVAILFFLQNNLTAAPLVLPRPVPLQAETIAHLKHAHANEDSQWQLVVFGFTRCKDVCPTSLGNLYMLIQAAAAENIAMNGTFVSIDPDRDSADALSSYTERFGSDISYLRFEGEELEQFKDNFGVEVVFYTKNAGNMENYQVDHSTTAFLIDPEGRIKVMFDAVKDAASIAELFKEKRELF
ncbi:SCO family protein [Nitrosomonas sp.]|uniref:SCO family protein n=1 Tax=Nitrosomonas sp. TaxID=42353 RepID=UPI001D9B6F72|nr:SCO family protein [Nitrosomonas sp.]MCB1949305.1 SCO family protein [Nitrosomonas sp.]MCP5242844.1 SCO family protein [Burkholderiales bacterium]MDR4514401.1 SCO family protein [Nitrosomonas sp.]